MKKAILLLISIVLLSSCRENPRNIQMNSILQEGMNKLRYNNPDLLVDLDVGFKSIPMPMDFDGDGDLDLLVSESGAYVEAGIFYFENLSGDVEMPVFRHGEKISSERFNLGLNWDCFEVSNVDGKDHVVIADRNNEKLLIYRNFPKNTYWNKEEIPLDLTLPAIPQNRASRWKMVDFDADGKTDILGFLAINDSPGFSMLFFKNNSTNEKPSYCEPVEIKLPGNNPVKGISFNPLIADFDNDGDLDFIDVDSFAGFIYYENRGTPSQYKFREGKKMNCQGRAINMVSHYGGAVKATAIDWNKDGFMDMIAGDEDGKVSFIKNTGKSSDGVPDFLQPRFFQQKAKFVDLGALSTPRIFDWDGDGLDDIVSGNGVGNICFVKNLGGTIPSWDGPKLLEINGNPIRIIPSETLPNTEEPHWGYTNIDVGDWDGDQLPDILVNDHNGNVRWFKNTGSRKEPKLSLLQPVEVAWLGKPQKPSWTPGTSEGNELLAPWRTTPYLMDLNGDKLMDLVMLDYEGYLATYFRSKGVDGKLLLSAPKRNFVDPDGNPIRLNPREQKSNGRTKFSFADWDGDGLKDLIFSSKPAVDWMKNRGTKDGNLVLQYMGRVVSQTLMGHADCPVTSDWNQDGIPDLLVGTETGVLYYWERPTMDQTSTMTTVGKQKPSKFSLTIE